MELSVREWNIRGAAALPWNNGYELKNWIADEIVKDVPDIIILTEFVVAKGWDYLQEKLEKHDYRWFISATTGKNGILIAVKNKPEFDFGDITKYEDKAINDSSILKLPKHDIIPNFYEVKIQVNGKPLSIVGVRIIEDNKEEQFLVLDEYLKTIDNLICAGDFNAFWYSKENGWLWGKENMKLYETAKSGKELYTPPYNHEDGFSYVHKDGTKAGIDHVISNFEKTYVEYYWYFLTDEHGYEGYTKNSIKKPIGIPNHAILNAKVKIKI